MKKKVIGAIALSALVALQMPMVALAEDRTTKIVDESMTVNGNVTVGNETAIQLGNIKTQENSFTVVVNGDVSNESSINTVKVGRNSGNSVTVTGTVTNNGTNTMGGAISAEKGTVEAGSAVADSKQYAVYAWDASTVTVHGNVTNNGTGVGIDAGAASKVTVGSVTSTTDAKAICATGTGTVVTVKAEEGVTGATGDVTNNGKGLGIQAKNGATVIAGNVTGGNSGIHAESGAKVIADNVTTTKGEDPDCDGVNAYEENTIVLVKNNVSAQTGVFAGDKATIIVLGTVSGKNWFGAGTEEGGKILAYEIKAGDAGMIYGSDEDISYIIKGLENSNISSYSGTTEADYTSAINDGNTYKFNTAKKDQVITLSVANGYELRAGEIKVVQNADGTYSVTVPQGGGVTLEAIMKAVEEAEAKASFTGNVQNAVTGGRWNMGPGGTWTYRNNGIFKDTWGYITLENGRTGWFYFDKNGVMLTGWQTINGKEYYFNEAHDGTYGMMLSNTTTPDGKKVGADGAKIQ